MIEHGKPSEIEACESDPMMYKNFINNSKLYEVQLTNQQRPIVYSSCYDIWFFGLERLHPFDAGKWGRVRNILIEDKTIMSNMLVEPNMAEDNDLLVAHSKRYLDSLKWSARVATIVEVPIIALIPNCLIEYFVLKKFRYQTGGTVLASKLALDHGWAINIGGGFHHCSGDQGGGFCVYADISLALKFLFEKKLIKSAMIVDLDAHQGNGHERDFADEPRVFILDMFNADIYPGDRKAKDSIKCCVELHSGCTDEQYLPILQDKLKESLHNFKADLIIYNAGTDCLAGDSLGHMSISEKGIIKRDEIVFEECRKMDIPIVMVTSGGYQRNNAHVIANSLRNLKSKELILKPNQRKLLICIKRSHNKLAASMPTL